MVEHTLVLKTEQDFFAALIGADVHTLAQLLDEDFVLIDLSGDVHDRSGLISALHSGQIKFESIRILDSEVRLYGETAVVTGETEMRGSKDGQTFEAFSRYTHVYREQEDDSFQLVSAHGTLVNRAAHP
jgi:ketosteroid isomerase-like protein